jgi:hypothetical protein
MATFSRLAFPLALASWTLISCSAPVLKTEVLAPARSSEASKIREIAVLPFDGPNGKEMSADLGATLAGVTLEDKSYFILADPARVEKILKEQGVSQVGTMGESAVAQVGKLLGAKGVYTGVVTAMAVKNSSFTEVRRVCLQSRSTTQTVSKSPEENCINWNKYSVDCLKKEGIVSFTARLINVETGKVVYQTNVSEDAGSSICQDSKTKPPSEMDLILRAKDRAKLTFRKEVAPFFIVFDIPLMESKEGLTSKEAEQKLEQGLESVKRGRLDQACELWEAGSRTSPQSPSLIYNLGTCAEAREDWKTSSDLYKKAQQALGKPDDRITWGLERVTERQKSSVDQRK